MLAIAVEIAHHNREWPSPDEIIRGEAESAVALPAEVVRLAKEREQARRDKNFKRGDELRDEISAFGWEARDTKDGQKITRRAGA